MLSVFALTPCVPFSPIKNPPPHFGLLFSPGISIRYCAICALFHPGNVFSPGELTTLQDRISTKKKR